MNYEVVAILILIFMLLFGILLNFVNIFMQYKEMKSGSFLLSCLFIALNTTGLIYSIILLIKS